MKKNHMAWEQGTLAGIPAATRPLDAAPIMRPWTTITVGRAGNAPIVTSRYQCRALADPRVLPVRTSRGRPRWKLPYELNVAIPELTPTRAMLALDDPAAFTAAYTAQLDRTGAGTIRAILDRLRDQHGQRTLALLCYEDIATLAPDGTESLCHRRVWADWWREQTGEEVPELVAA